MLAALHVPMFGFSCLAFLALCVVLACATWLVLRSGEKGTTKLGGFAGCMLGLGLVGVAGIMALGTGFVMALNAWNEVVRRGPVKSFEFQFDDGSRQSNAGGARPEEDAAGALDAEDRFAGRELTGGMDPAPIGTGRIAIVVVLRDMAAAQEVIGWVRDHIDADLVTEWDIVETEEGEFSRVTFSAELDPEEVARVRRDLEADFPGFELPTGGRIELHEPGR